MRRATMLALLLGTVFACVPRLHAQEKAPDLAGNWQGTLEAGKGLRTVLKITRDDGKLKGDLYSIDQGGQPLHMTSVSLDGHTVTFTIKPIDVAYTGTLNPDGNTISGAATQNGQTHPLNLQRVTAEAMWAIPEPPKSMPADAKPKFDVVTVKPSDPTRQGKGFTVRGRQIMTFNTNLNDLISFAYGLHAKQIVDAPDWFATEKYDITGVPDVEGRPSSAQLKMLIADALVQRFGLQFHKDQRELSIYALTVAKGGPKLTVTADKPEAPRNFLYRNFGDLHTSNVTMKDFCDGLQGSAMDKPVVDQTGLTDRYDFNLKWTPDESQFTQFGPRPPTPPSDDPNAPPSLYTALEEQLGLKMTATRGKAEVYVIDHAERPSAN